jgi:hypothetical protein
MSVSLAYLVTCTHVEGLVCQCQVSGKRDRLPQLTQILPIGRSSGRRSGDTPRFFGRNTLSGSRAGLSSTHRSRPATSDVGRRASGVGRRAAGGGRRSAIGDSRFAIRDSRFAIRDSRFRSDRSRARAWGLGLVGFVGFGVGGVGGGGGGGGGGHSDHHLSLIITSP